MKPRTMKLNAHRVLHYYLPEDVDRMLGEARAGLAAVGVPEEVREMCERLNGLADALHRRRYPQNAELVRKAAAMLAAAPAERTADAPQPGPVPVTLCSSGKPADYSEEPAP